MLNDLQKHEDGVKPQQRYNKNKWHSTGETWEVINQEDRQPSQNKNAGLLTVQDKIPSLWGPE
jgi:hypothetical protein